MLFYLFTKKKKKKKKKKSDLNFIQIFYEGNIRNVKPYFCEKKKEINKMKWNKIK